MSRWFRFYADAMRNPKVMRLADNDFRLWVRLLAVASENDGHLPPIADLKLLLSARLDRLADGLQRLINTGLIDVAGQGYEPHNWSKFQYKSDTSTPRVTLHRAKRNVTVTPPDTEADTEQKEDSANALSCAVKPRRKASRCSDDWTPSPLPADLAAQVAAYPPGWEERQLAGMRDWSKASPNGAKLDWDATWRGWLRRTIEREPSDGRSKPMGGNGGQGARQYRRDPAWEGL
jgi:hypothetical protein